MGAEGAACDWTLPLIDDRALLRTGHDELIRAGEPEHFSRDRFYRGRIVAQGLGAGLELRILGAKRRNLLRERLHVAADPEKGRKAVVAGENGEQKHAEPE